MQRRKDQLPGAPPAAHNPARSVEMANSRLREESGGGHWWERTRRGSVRGAKTVGERATGADQAFRSPTDPQQMAIVVELLAIPDLLDCLAGEVTDGVTRTPIVTAEDGPAVRQDIQRAKREGAGGDTAVQNRVEQFLPQVQVPLLDALIRIQPRGPIAGFHKIHSDSVAPSVAGEGDLLPFMLTLAEKLDGDPAGSQALG